MADKRKTGKVYLIGAGPGNPKLITLRGKEILETCDAVVYDSLVPVELLSHAEKARKLHVGKRGGRKSSTRQTHINRLLQRLAREGKKVARLKGGDPYIFGRGGEEALFLAQRKIPFEVVPGVTAATGAAAYAGIPLTHRDWASQVTFVTGHEDPRKETSALSWGNLARSGGTLVFYMGVMRLREIVRRLLDNGLVKNTPVAVIQWATTPLQNIVTGTLDDIVKKAGSASIASPALTIVGPAVKLGRKLDWFSKQPLRGKTVMITRAKSQAGFLKRELEELGASVCEFPTIEILPPENYSQVDSAISELSRYDWVVFTSTNGVEKFMERIQTLGKDMRVFGGIKIAAIGPATASRLHDYHLRADLVPSEYVSEALADALVREGSLHGKKILLVRADIARDYLIKELSRRGASVENLVCYRTRPESGNGRNLARRFQKSEIDFVTFTSSSTAKNFVSVIGSKMLSKIKRKTRWVSIGPITSKTAQAFGLKIHRQAKNYTIRGLVDAVKRG